MSKISAGNGYFIETLEDGYKVLRCPDDKLGIMPNGISSDKSISLNRFRKICKEWIDNRTKIL